MKASFDKEMDDLLRRHARRAEGSALQAQEARHMDADEISAYAENALPAATRLRYAAHLAECDQCRRLVVAGALAANVAGELEKQAASSEPARATASAWRERLAALFSVRALRYASLALALVLVGAVAFIALRFDQAQDNAGLLAEQRGEEAQRPSDNAPSATTATAPAETEQAGLGANSTGTLAGRQDDARASANQSVTGRGAETSATPDNDDELLARRVEETRTGASAQSVPQAAPAPPVANEPVEAAQAPARPSADLRTTAPPQTSNSNASVASAREPQPGRTAREGESAEQQGRDAGRRSAPPPAAASGAAAGVAADAIVAEERRRGRTANRAARPRSQAQVEEDQMQRAETAETRTVGGRTFRRQGGAWVDTAYRASQRTTVVARGSEQYRALIADEPALGRIVQQLGGEVVIVWNGRAYRIR